MTPWALIVALKVIVTAPPAREDITGLCETCIGHHDHRAAERDYLIPLEPRQAVFKDEGGATFLTQQAGEDFRLGMVVGSVDAPHLGSSSQRTVAPGFAPWSASSRNRSLPPSPADRIMPSDRPKRILRGARLAMNTTLRPSSLSGSP